MSHRVLDNPFYVLGVRPDATRQVIEREGQKLLSMLALGLLSAASYATPVGRGARTEDKVRQAMAELRDPERRLSHELWARLDSSAPAPAQDDDDDERRARAEGAGAPWPGALAALGWRRA